MKYFNKKIKMLNSERQNLNSSNNSVITYYSKLGYIEVDKNEILDKDKDTVNYNTKEKTKSGIINVILNLKN